MTTIVSRYAIPLIIIGAHIALYIVGTLNGPAPELAAVIL